MQEKEDTVKKLIVDESGSYCLSVCLTALLGCTAKKGTIPS